MTTIGNQARLSPTCCAFEAMQHGPGCHKDELNFSPKEKKHVC